jgi:hypothetical protein
VTLADIARALGRLSLAAGLASALALRPRRLGTPQRRPAVIHTQIILSVVGALVMLVVGSSLARAFGIVGAAGLVRYRAKIEDPKDAGVMLSTLAVGLATGVGLWPIAITGAIFLILLLWVVESFEPTATRSLAVTIRTKDVAALKRRIEAHLRRQGATVELRGVAPEEIVYEVHWPMDQPTDRLSEHLAALDGSGSAQVTVEPTKEKS